MGSHLEGGTRGPLRLPKRTITKLLRFRADEFETLRALGAARGVTDLCFLLRLLIREAAVAEGIAEDPTKRLEESLAQIRQLRVVEGTR